MQDQHTAPAGMEKERARAVNDLKHVSAVQDIHESAAGRLAQTQGHLRGTIGRVHSDDHGPFLTLAAERELFMRDMQWRIVATAQRTVTPPQRDQLLDGL